MGEIKDDEIFLLSAEEYEKYKGIIPKINMWWWLRTPGGDPNYAAYVNFSGSVINYGHDVRSNNGAAVRPALQISSQESENLNIGNILIKYNFPWIKISDSLVIAEVPIAFHIFDKISNEYETSKIRQFLLNWIEERKIRIAN